MEKQTTIWILLADTRRKLLWLWLAFTGVILALLVFMTIANIFEGVEGAAWTWLFSCLLPVLTLLFVGIVLNLQPSKVLKKSAFRLVFYVALGYLVLTLGTLLEMQAWLDSHSNAGIDQYFQQSYLWLLPFQGLLLVGVWILYFRPSKRVQADEKIVLGYAQKKAEYAHHFGNVKQQTAFDYLVQNDFTNLFEFLKTQYDGNSDQKEVILLQSQYNNIQEKLNFNTADPAATQRDTNRISMALIDLIEKL